MAEVAEQLILEYLGKVADAAHGELSSQERLDFCSRLRRRIEEHRRGSNDPRQVRQVLARFGDPKYLVARERRRLDEIRAATASAALGDGQVRTLEEESKDQGSKDQGFTEQGSTGQGSTEGGSADQGSAEEGSANKAPSRLGRPPRRARAPVRTVRRDGRTTRRFTWSPSGAARLRRELRKENSRGPFARLMNALREGWRSSFRRRRTG
ncbi:hypothetical protein [Actinomadura rudentiformis]|uniref:Uncharacterized protein n=1 Tax=Actinomadura rudentiformis TaxID=359158 RepID=A0A6H9YL21_9ACTN|nr:hypothetical protein [Actinomadura rudentiformis]KAB2337814.1 hypothetical protein F8566_49365 [Actinomadura rudentiformis]